MEGTSTRRFAVARAGGLVSVALCAGLMSIGCGTDTAPPDAPPGAATLGAIREDIFNASCALGSCHAPPTLAAKLNLRDNGLCALLVKHTSCLFEGKLLVVPGKPEASFLMDKLRGTNLTGEPDPACGTNNQRMPLGLPQLPADKLAQIEQWIRDGADCGSDVPVDAGVIDAPVDAADDVLAEVASISAAATTIKSGERTMVTVTLTKPAPLQGQAVFVDAADDAILGVDATGFAEKGETSAVIMVTGRAAGTTTVTAMSGTTSKSLQLTVTAAAFSDLPEATWLGELAPVSGSVLSIR